jgi:hypothetical protein
MADIKPGTSAILDHDLLGDKATMSHDDAMHFGALTEEELVIEKKLVRKIDMLIMPLVVLVYLMNYIDRYSLCPSIVAPGAVLIDIQKQLRSGSFTRPRERSEPARRSVSDR